MQIKIRDLSYTYHPKSLYEKKALKNINLDIDDKDFIGIIGKTGSGKTTLIDIIAGLNNGYLGDVYLNNIAIDEYKDIRKEVAYLFQFPEKQLFETTVSKDVGFSLRYLDIKKEEKDKLISEALELVGFNYDDIKDKSPLEFSYGEKRKIAIAGILVLKPKLLILDEPTSSLDSSSREFLLNLLEDLNKIGTTIIMVSHDIDALAKLTNRILILDNGEIIKDDKSKEILSDTKLLNLLDISVSEVVDIVNKLDYYGFNIDRKTIKYNELLDQLIEVLK